ncbi:MAG: thioesterase family protein [Mucilaginibacter sp.]|nr:thioesterase family protein [Mucilaginibacter sp.]
MFSTPYKVNLRWSDLDPNFHLKHSSYYDLASQHRIEMLNYYGLTLKVMEEQHFAPILMREECIFFREIKYADLVYIHLKIKEVNSDGSRWTLVHEFVDDKKKKKAQLTVEIVWFDIQKRRIAKPLPEAAANTYKLIMEEQEKPNSSDQYPGA